MSGNFRLLADNVDVQPLLRDLDANPDLWDQRPERRAGDSPHRETSDIWCRYASEDDMRQSGFFGRPHKSENWPAWHVLPHLLPTVLWLMGRAQCRMMGGVLITRIGPGKQVYPHHDRGSWHSEYYTTKVWTVLRGNARCINSVEGEEMVWRPGEAWTHSNLVPHSVVNGGSTERICLISCFREWP